MKSTNAKQTGYFKLAFTTLLLSCGFAHAQDDIQQEAVSWYQIEIMLFKNNQVQGEDNLQTALPNKLIPEQRYVLVTGETMVPNQLQRLPLDSLKLNKSFNAIKRSKNYDILEFAGWKQPLTKEQRDIPVTIAAGTQYGDQYEAHGNITFRKNRYLHVDADFYIADYTPGDQFNLQDWLLKGDVDAGPFTPSNGPSGITPPKNTETSPLFLKHTNPSEPNYDAEDIGSNDATDAAQDTEKLSVTNYIATNIAHLKETRRMRSGEIHYLDHPRFGLLVTIEPTDPPFVMNTTEQSTQESPPN